jgi:lambda family phage tail tape measure protein
MADLNYSLNIDDRQALASLQRTQAAIQRANQQFTAFSRTLGAFAVGAFVTSSVQMAAALDDIATSSGIALQNVIGFGQAVQANGGTLEGANTGIARFAQFLDSAAQGSKTAQNALGELGITLTDLRTLSDQEVLQRVISGLAGVNDNARRTALGVDIFGKSFAAVDFRGVNSGLAEFTRLAGPNAAAIKAAADAEQSFVQAITDLKTVLLVTLAPLSEATRSILDFVKSNQVLVDVLKTVVPLLLGFLAVGKLLSLVGAAFRTLTTAVAGLKGAGQGLAVTFGSLLTQIRAVWREKAVTSETILGLQKRFRYLSQELPILGKGLAAIITLYAGLSAAVKSFFGVQAQDDGSYDRAETAKFLRQQTEARQRDIKSVQDGNAAEKQSIRDAITGYRATQQELQAKLRSQTELNRATEEQRFVVETQREAEQAYLKAIEPLLKKQQEIRAKGAEATPLEIQLLADLQRGVAAITQEYQAQLPALNQAIQAHVEELLVVRELQRNADLLTQAAERRAAVEAVIRDTILEGQERVNRAYEDAALNKLPELARRLKEIEQEENRIAQAARRRIAEQFGDDTAGLAQALSEIDAATARVTQQRQAQAQAVYEEQRSFAFGWQQAFEEYVASATNAGEQARNIFQASTRGMEDAIVNFAKTGKLNFKSFLSSIVEMILRSQIQRLIAQIFGGSSAGGNLFTTFLTSLFGGGRAGGGPVASNRAYVVGERGPELFMPRTPGTIIPNGAAMGGTTQVTYNINAVDASSFRNLVASDPEFIFAVTEQGRRRQPTTRR